MSKVLRSMVAATIVTIVAALPANAFKGKSQVVPQGTSLSVAELQAIYSGRSWLWRDGVAYFDRSGRFVSVTGLGARVAHVDGGWGAYNNGKLCFSGTWRSASGSGFDSTCFSHMRAHGAIYQKREPYGRWYVFKHPSTRPDDEFRKLVRGDRVKSRLQSVTHVAQQPTRKVYGRAAAPRGASRAPESGVAAHKNTRTTTR